MIVPAVTQAEKTTLLEYLAVKIDERPENLVGRMPYEIVAAVRNGQGVGAVLYTNFRGYSVEMCWAGDPGWITRGALRAIFAYPFNELGVLRAYGSVKRSNGASRQFCKRIGCREVGVLEDEFGPGIDAILYTITKARWADGAALRGRRRRADRAMAVSAGWRTAEAL